MTQSNPSRSSGGISVGAVIGIAVLALIGGAMLTYALLTAFGGGNSAQPTAIAQNTQPPTPAVVIPTATSVPPTQAVPAATDTVAAPAATDTVAAPPPTTAPTNLLNILQPANVRSGPGTNYPPIGGLQPGTTAEAIGRDTSAQWYVVSYFGQQGWVSNIVAQYTGDTNALPVVAAPPTPIPTNTSVPPTATRVPPTNTQTSGGGGGGAGGIRGDYFELKSTAREYSVNQQIWFKFKVTNTSGNALAYRCLGAKALNATFAQCSWGNNSTDQLGVNQVVEWEDHIELPAGTYNLVLGICTLGDTGACRSSASAGWLILSNSIQITVK
jgi:uncharacterized protein YraI